jgi:hypothetical protein
MALHERDVREKYRLMQHNRRVVLFVFYLVRFVESRIVFGGTPSPRAFIEGSRFSGPVTAMPNAAGNRGRRYLKNQMVEKHIVETPHETSSQIECDVPPRQVHRRTPHRNRLVGPGCNVHDALFVFPKKHGRSGPCYFCHGCCERMW